MTKEEYVLENDQIDAEILKLMDIQASLKHKYIAENSKFKVGDKVLVSTGDKHELGYVYDYFLWYDNSVHPCIRKLKKDGGLSIRLLKYNKETAVIEKL